MPVPEPQFDELYREVILDHFRRPRNRGALTGAGVHVEGLNPTCGDEVRLDIAVEGGRIRDIAFDGAGCSISVASASLLTDRLRGTTLDEADSVAGEFKAMLLEGEAPSPALGDLEALQGVAQFPVRIKCAILAWNVLQEGLNQARVAATGGQS